MWTLVFCVYTVFHSFACAPAEVSTSTGQGSETSEQQPCPGPPEDVAQMRACPLSSCPESYLYNNPNSCDGPLEVDGYEDGYSPEELCILQRLADGAPVRIELRETCEGYTSRRTIDVLGPTVAMLTGSESQPCADCACGSQTEWGGLDLCTLRAPESFLSCLQASERKYQLGCMVPETWFLDCSPSGPQCTP